MSLEIPFMCVWLSAGTSGRSSADRHIHMNEISSDICRSLLLSALAIKRDGALSPALLLAPFTHRPVFQESFFPGHCSGLKSHPVICKFGTEKRGLTAYLLSAEEMSKKNFPLIGSPGCEDFVCTDSDPVVSDSSPLFGLDCEMTVVGLELTRVSLVDSSGACVLDELVKPPNRIRNYLTQFSGVTRQMLKPVYTSLSEVQVRLRSLLPRDAVLVGHSLENDLRALKMVHPHVIDSSLLYRRHCGQRFKLKVLTETLLGKQIQTEDRRGHDPCEDALAALELVQYFISKGPLKIVEEHQEQLWGFTLTEEPSSPAAEEESSDQSSSRFSDVLQARERSVLFCGRRSDLHLHLSKQQWLGSDRQVLQAFRHQPKCASFSVLQFCPRQRGALQPRSGHRPALLLLLCGPVCAVRRAPPSSLHRRRCEAPVLLLRAPALDPNHTHSAEVHAELRFERPEAALLALSALNSLTLQGHSLKVQRPVTDSTWTWT
ncbi:hypothetical protein WMY93_006032 [Mugilogobius chulae]|uniref:Exonuclease domain-containing protein n=1 Tax=Mugilogobius chulae TaxID=88201 RepID=A0AAW0PL90_9GOBI